MRNLVLAFLLALLGIVAAFSVLAVVGVPPATAVGVATAIIGGVPYIHQHLDKRTQSSKGEMTSRLVSLEGFGIPMSRLALYGALLMFSALQLMAGLGGVIAGITGAGLGGAVPVVVILFLLFGFPALFLIGRWIGRRTVTHGIITVVVAAVVTRILTTLFDFVFMPDEAFVEMFGQEKNFKSLGTQLLGGAVLFSSIALLGYWRGRRQRLSAYLGYLLKHVTEDARNAIVELAFEEARRRVRFPQSADGA